MTSIINLSYAGTINLECATVSSATRIKNNKIDSEYSYKDFKEIYYLTLEDKKFSWSSKKDVEEKGSYDMTSPYANDTTQSITSSTNIDLSGQDFVVDFYQKINVNAVSPDTPYSIISKDKWVINRLSGELIRNKLLDSAPQLDRYKSTITTKGNCKKITSRF